MVHWQDVATQVIAEGLKPDETLVSRVMTRDPIFDRNISSGSLTEDGTR